jgi:hypothetical protein
MTYTDEELLDLLEDLHEVGLVETPYEEAERLRIEALEDFRRRSNLKLNLDITKWLLDRSHSHTYVLTLKVNPLNDLMYTMLDPVVKGHVIFPNRVLPLEELEANYPRPFYYYQSLEELKKGLIYLGEFHLGVTPDKYSFLDIV